MEERLQKVMSNCGVASRRASEKMILEGRVRVNGVIVRELGTKVDPDKDRIADSVLQHLADGVELKDGMTAPADVYYIGYDPKTNLTSVEITIHEGRNRQVRRMFEFFGYQVHNLRRVQYAFLTLSGVKRGAYRKLTREEVAELYKYK